MSETAENLLKKIFYFGFLGATITDLAEKGKIIINKEERDKLERLLDEIESLRDKIFSLLEKEAKRYTPTKIIENLKGLIKKIKEA